MISIGSTVTVRGIAYPVTITNIINTANITGYAGKYNVKGVEMNISWIPSGLITY